MATKAPSPVPHRLIHRIDIEEEVIDRDSDGNRIPTWVTIRNESDEPDLIPAEMAPFSGREFYQSAAVQASVDTRCCIWFREGVEPKQRVVFEGRYYDIKAVLPDKTFRRHLNLMLQSGVNDG